MLKDDFPLIHEEFSAMRIAPQEMDALWAAGWRHFGTHFFRYNVGFCGREIRLVIPLRIRLADFSFSKSQRRVVRKNQDLRIVTRPAAITEEKESLFERHKRRFTSGVPASLYDFLSTAPASVPCEALEICAYRDERLLAASFFDVGAAAVSAVYAMFEPEEAARGLGILTMLLEIEHARAAGKRFYYQGYAYEGESFYDYKKRFRALEMYDWRNGWEDFAPD